MTSQCLFYFLKCYLLGMGHGSVSFIALWTGSERIAANLVDKHPSRITLVGGLHLDPFSTNLKGTQAGFHQIGNTYLEGLAIWRWGRTQHILVVASNIEL